MNVRFKQSLDRDPVGKVKRGDIKELDDKLAALWIRAGYCDQATETKPAKKKK